MMLNAVWNLLISTFVRRGTPSERTCSASRASIVTSAPDLITQAGIVSSGNFQNP
ncbi:putative site-specific DNA-methyltransferase [Pseudomonas phage MR15]|uniref:Putative site-specific DNA-methyltransferase n=1 Tax=Pseudomonas phage MR15 TaxID=2711179 RepID=A0A6M3TE02_9CAUD|nr:putative site-specific DNA-methyltransferase [Pseudomonas phage MR15]QJD55091.1 putative site-specific DNA-methyltransferase [Pseudomonas phage MR13]QJD55243.1 putative site-specific DNA-methyltransferase [Pseudomonas phage MR15]